MAAGLRKFLLANEAADSIAGLCTYAKPMLDTLGIKLNLRGLFERVVSADRLLHTAIAWTRPFDHNDAIERLLLFANSR